MTSLARYSCPRCKNTYDVWLDDEELPEKVPWCPACRHASSGMLVLGVYDEEQTSLYGGEDPDAA